MTHQAQRPGPAEAGSEWSRVLVSVDELASALDSGAPPLVMHVADGPVVEAVQQYQHGHIPDAVFVHLQRDLVGEPTIGSGRRPLPTIENLTESLRRLGVSQNRPTVVYDHCTMFASRAWWTLRWAGIRDVWLLDGGWPRWMALRRPIERRTPPTPAGPHLLDLMPGNMPTLSTEDVESLAGRMLIDARPFAQYCGDERSALDAALPAGHIPGAVNLPAGDLIDGATGLLHGPEQIRAQLTRKRIDAASRLGVYCGGGVAGALTVLALASAQIPAELFVGSWSAWAAGGRRPVRAGPTP